MLDTCPGYDVKLPGGIPLKKCCRLDAEALRSVRVCHINVHHRAVAADGQCHTLACIDIFKHPRALVKVECISVVI